MKWRGSGVIHAMSSQTHPVYLAATKITMVIGTALVQRIRHLKLYIRQTPSYPTIWWYQAGNYQLALLWLQELVPATVLVEKMQKEIQKLPQGLHARLQANHDWSCQEHDGTYCNFFLISLASTVQQCSLQIMQACKTWPNSLIASIGWMPHLLDTGFDCRAHPVTQGAVDTEPGMAWHTPCTAG